MASSSSGEPPHEMGLAQVQEVIAAAAAPNRTSTAIFDALAALPEGCTCLISAITLRRERGETDCPVHPRERVTHDSIVWEQIPEQTVCVCAHVKAIHRRGSVPACSTRSTHSAPTETLGTIKILGTGCACPYFHDADHPMGWGLFADRFFGAGTFNGYEKKLKKANTRRRIALGWAWKQSGLGQDEPRTWDRWMHESKRVWRAWRAAGSPIVAFGRETSYGAVSIPGLEDR